MGQTTSISQLEKLANSAARYDDLLRSLKKVVSQITQEELAEWAYSELDLFQSYIADESVLEAGQLMQTTSEQRTEQSFHQPTPLSFNLDFAKI